MTSGEDLDKKVTATNDGELSAEELQSVSGGRTTPGTAFGDRMKTGMDYTPPSPPPTMGPRG